MRSRIVIALFCLLLLPLPFAAQSPAGYATSTTLAQLAPREQEPPISEQQREAQRRMAKQNNAHRQQQLKRDTDRLLQLATELKLYVDKSNENVLSLEVIKKTEEIEKLARSVREKMKTAY